MKRILVIESNLVYQAEICWLLHFERYRVIRAKNGVDGLNLALQKQPDLVLCDVKMDDLTGYEVLESLRSDASIRKIPFVFFAGRTDSGSHSYAIKLGASAYLSKLIPPREFLQAISSQLRQRY